MATKEEIVELLTSVAILATQAANALRTDDLDQCADVLTDCERDLERAANLFDKYEVGK